MELGIIWFAILIPIILIVLLMLNPKWRIRTLWWETLIPIVATIITILICQYIAVNSAVSDIEYWGHNAVSITHVEPASYEGECSTTYACGETCSGSGKNRSCSTQYCTRYYRCIKDSGRKCYINNDKGDSYYITYNKFNELAGKKRWNWFKHKKSIEVYRDSHYVTKGDYYKRPGYGNRHQVYWNEKWEVAEPIVESHTYENRLQTLSHWGEITEKEKKEYGIYNYPSVPPTYLLRAVMSEEPKYQKTNHYLRYLNGYLNTLKGRYKKVRLWLLIYNNKNQTAAELQRSYWKGGNKNEIIIMIGTNNNNDITWCDVMAPTDDAKSEEMKITLRDIILIDMKDGKKPYSGKLTDEDLFKFSKFWGNQVKSNYTKPSFKQYAYIQVQPSMNALIISYSIVLVVNILTGIFVILNPWEERNKKWKN